MKKITFLLVAMVALFSTVSCTPATTTEDPVTPVAPVGSPALTIAVPSKLGLASGAITLSVAADAAADINIAITNSNATVLEAATTAVIKKGSKSITAAIKGLAVGEAVLSFASAEATIATKDYTVKVEEIVEVVKYEYPYMQYYTYVGISKVTVGETVLTSTCDDAPEGADKTLAGNNDFYESEGTTCVNDNFTDKSAKVATGTAFEILFDPYTSTKDNDIYQLVFFIDWNGNGKFGDTTEEIIIANRELKGATAEAVSGTITVPAGAVESARCRVIVGKFTDADPGTIKEGNEALGNGYFMDFMFTTK